MAAATPEATAPTPMEVTPTETAAPADLGVLVANDIATNVRLVMRSAATKEARHIARAVRLTMVALRRKLTANALHAAVRRHLPEALPVRATLLACLPATMTTTTTVADGNSASSAEAAPAKEVSASAEVLAYLELLVVIWLLDSGREHWPQAYARSVDLVRHAAQADGALDLLVARCWFYHARAVELCRSLGQQQQQELGLPSAVALRAELLSAHKTAGLRRMEETRATLLNLLLRDLLAAGLYEQADKLVSKQASSAQDDPQQQMAAAAASNNQLARYNYYVGRIRATQLDYSGAHDALQQALQKAPQGSGVARGFRLAATRLLVIVQLLMGDIPERSVFSQRELRTALKPYLRLTQAVRIGNLAAFRAAAQDSAATFAADGTLSLVSRLRHNVIKTALRKICFSYSRISLADIAAKLHLEDPEGCEYVVAKAIRDGVIDAVIDHDGGFVQSREILDIYATQEPQAALGRRIAFCLRLHNDALRSMRYAPDAHKPRPLQDTDEDTKHLEEEVAKLEEEEDADI